MAELVTKLSEKLYPQLSGGPREEHGGVNRNRLTVGVDLGDQWSSYCILGLEGEKLAEGQLQTKQQEIVEFFQAMAPARVVMEVGTHSAWVREIVIGFGHEVLVANPRQMDGAKRRRKNDRIDAHKLAHPSTAL
jgi:transposase